MSQRKQPRASRRSEERILTLHPARKHGVRIARSKYDAMRRAILRCVPRSARGIPLGDLTEQVPDRLQGDAFGPDDRLTWYLIAVKQDLEARGEIEQVPGGRRQRLRRPANRGTR